MKLIDAVYKVLVNAAQPMSAKEIERLVIKRRLFKSNGETLYATIGARLYVELKKYGEKSRFVKCGKGLFAVAGSSAAKKVAAFPERRASKHSSKKTHDFGYVYILTNPSFRRDWVKIGKTCRRVNVRSAELDNTAVPLPFEVFATMKTVDYEKAERLIHKMIDRFTRKRIRKNREFFNIEPEKALEIFEDVRTVFDDAVIERFDEGSQENRPRPNKSSSSEGRTFLCCGGGANAKAKVLKDGIVVMRGSKVSTKIVPSMRKYARSMFELRKKLEHAGVIVDGVFRRPYEFSSSSAAASLIQGRNSNGNNDWRTEDGVKLGALAK